MGANPVQNADSLRSSAAGNAEATAQLIVQIYSELRALAANYLRGERPGHTLQPTALVNEAYLRLIKIDRVDWQGKSHFFAMAAREMRRVLVEHARTRNADKRGGGLKRVTLAEDVALVEGRLVDVMALDQALNELELKNSRRAQVVELRVFGGLQIQEIAVALNVSERSVKEDWRMARAQIGRTLGRAS